MAFLRTSFSALKANKRENFESTYKFRKKVTNFKAGSDVYVIPLGLDRGYFETPTHRIGTHEVDGQTIGFGGAGFGVNVRCKGYDEFGNRVESLCCKLAKMEKERFPEQADSVKRIINFSSYRIHIPILILGNSLVDKSKISYPVSKVSILGDLGTEKGLNFSYLEMASSTFQKDIFNKFGSELKDKGLIDYELAEGTEEHFEQVGQHLQNCIIKVRGVTKQGFAAALQEYSFFPFSDPAIASGSAPGERDAIINYRSNNQIMEKVNEYLQLFNAEVDGLIRNWTDAELQEYYNSATGKDLKANIPSAPQQPVERVEVITSAQSAYTAPTQVAQPVVQPAQQAAQTMVGTQEVPFQQSAVQQAAQPQPEAATEADIDSFLEDPFKGQNPVASAPESSTELEDFDMELGDDEDFLS